MSQKYRTLEPNLLLSICAELGSYELIFQELVAGKDIDIIVSYDTFQSLCFNRNFIKVNNRYWCDRHCFYLYLYGSEIYLLDFNIGGLFRPGRYNYPVDIIPVVARGGVQYISPDFQLSFREAKRNSRLSPRYFLAYIAALPFRYQKLNFDSLKIAFLGMDGAGKTTTIENVRARIHAATRIEYMGWKNFTNPLLMLYRKYLKRRLRRSTKDPVSDVLQAKSLMAIITYYSELGLRYTRAMFGKKAFVIFYDRYFIDWYARYPSGIVKGLLYRITPKPDLIIYLTAPADILHRRKGEATLKQIQELSALYENELRMLDNVYIVDTSQRDEAEVISSIFEVLRNVEPIAKVS